jgi:hypothetical protein
MEHGPSGEADWFSASQEIPRILWNPKVHYRIHKYPPPVLILIHRISSGPRHMYVFRGKASLYGEELLAHRLTPKLDDHTLSAVRHCLFNIFAVALHMGERLLHPQPDDAPCRGDRDPLIRRSTDSNPPFVISCLLWSINPTPKVSVGCLCVLVCCVNDNVCKLRGYDVES